MELLQSLVDLITAASHDEKIVYLSDKKVEEQVPSKKREISKLIRSALNEGKLSIVPSYKTYCPTGKFLMESILKFWWELANRIDKEGYRSAIIAGDISWVSRHASLFPSFLQYEQSIDLYGVPKNIRIICQYDSRLFNSQQIESAIKVHQLVLRGQTLERKNWIVSRKLDNSVFFPSMV
jgi:hypothetical protein